MNDVEYWKAADARAAQYAEELGRAEAILESLVLALESRTEMTPIAIDSAKRWLNDQAVRRAHIEALRDQREGR